MKVTLFKTSKAFNAELADFTTSAEKIDQRLHRLLCSALVLAAPGMGGDRNVDRIGRILSAMPKSGRLEAAIHWCKSFAPVVIRKEKDGVHVSLNKSVKGKDWEVDINAAMERPFWEFSKERPPGPVDFRSMLSSMSTRLQKVLSGEVESKQNPDQVAHIQAGIDGLLATLKA